jgi:hypothetical protein
LPIALEESPLTPAGSQSDRDWGNLALFSVTQRARFVRAIVRRRRHDGPMKITSLLDRAIYSYADVDRLNGLTPGAGRRWLEGHERAGVFYEPVLRPEPTGANVVTWREMVEARLLAEFRGQRVSLQRLRPAAATAGGVRESSAGARKPVAQCRRPRTGAQGPERGLLDRQLQLVVVRNDQLMLDLRAQRFQNSRHGELNHAVSGWPLML